MSFVAFYCVVLYEKIWTVYLLAVEELDCGESVWRVKLEKYCYHRNNHSSFPINFLSKYYFEKSKHWNWNQDVNNKNHLKRYQFDEVKRHEIHSLLIKNALELKDRVLNLAKQLNKVHKFQKGRQVETKT